MKPLRHIPDILHRFKERSDHQQAFSYRKKGVWTHYSSREVLNNIQCIALALNDLGLQKGDRVGIYAKSSPFWSMADFAIALAGGVTVPFFSNLSDKHFFYEAQHSGPKWLFIGEEEEWESAKQHRHLFEGTVGMAPELYNKATLSIDKLIQIGDAIRQKDPQRLQKLEQAVSPDDLATIIYTSGSTGSPKGVELTHRNLVSIIHYDEFTLRAHDKYLSILPLAHIFAKQVHFIMTAWGVPVYFLNNLKKIPEACQEVPITRMITVPRVLEKAYSKMREKLENSSFLKRAIGTWAFNLAHMEDGLYKKIMHPIADKLVYSKVRNAFGPHFHSILSGGAALSPYLHRFYLSVGIPVLQGWGLTEGSTIAVNRVSRNKIGTVGPPIKSIEFKISKDGEVLAKGPTIMRGYHKNPEATNQAIDVDGWLHTGDYGHLDEEGHLVIEGRIAESFKTSRGEFVSPVPIEQKLAESSLIDMAMVIGENRPYPTALLFPDLEVIESLREKSEEPAASLEAFLQSSQITESIGQIITEINGSLDKWQKIRKWRLAKQPPTIEGGELTPTMKLRRKAILRKYEDVIAGMYDESLKTQQA